ncbi:MAG: pantoate--beta-alanine ligase [Syntrophomonadaceae bacterium]|nr:pantoate--beta-alanine ligase [Syntrophomonadaceae bacterium]
MQVFNDVKEMQNWCLNKKRQGQKIGLVPTMGYLHAGHLSLVKEAGRHCDIVVVSIFVNPTQFGPNEDFDSYPRDVESDRKKLAEEKVDAIFAPSARDMYREGYNSWVELKGEITSKLCGGSREGHFRGVTTVVSKLFNICQPDKAFFGQKDAQQAMIIEKMVQELNFPITIVRVPIVREADGLALSSRNVYLDEEQRRQALVLSRSLQKARQLAEDGERNVSRLKQEIRKMIEAATQANIDYVEIYDAEDLGDVEEIRGSVLIALAVKFGNTRLIDNLIVEV